MTASVHLTYTGVLLAVLAEQLCLPIPSVVFLMAAGALSSHGQMRTSIIVLLGVWACLAADGIWFWLGRRWGSKGIRLLCRFTADPRRCSKNAHDKFRRYGLRYTVRGQVSSRTECGNAATCRSGRSVAHAVSLPSIQLGSLPLVSVLRRAGLSFFE